MNNLQQQIEHTNNFSNHGGDNVNNIVDNNFNNNNDNNNNNNNHHASKDMRLLNDFNFTYSVVSTHPTIVTKAITCYNNVSLRTILFQSTHPTSIEVISISTNHNSLMVNKT